MTEGDRTQVGRGVGRSPRVQDGRPHTFRPTGAGDEGEGTAPFRAEVLNLG